MNGRPIRIPEAYPLVQDPPFSLKGSRTLLMVLPATRARLEAMCHRTFHWAAPEVVVEPLGSSVLLVLTDVAEARSKDPQHGFFSYREATFFVPVTGTRNGTPFVGMHVPFIYPNEGLAVAAGREIFGLPKKPASIEMPDIERVLDGSAAITVRALSAEVLDGSQWRERELLRITSHPHGAIAGAADTLLDAIDAAVGPLPLSGGLEHLLQQRLIQLKQVPDVSTHGTPPRVLLRAITEVKAPVRSLTNVRLADASKLRVTVANLATEPVREVLGLGSIVTPTVAASLEMDFTFEGGEVWLERPVQPSGPTSKTRVLVLGGGMGGLAAAHALTDTDERRARFEVTVMSMGHYLGGKGANLRHPDDTLGRRIEEHGIHVFFGFYHNALRLMRDVYAEANRAPNDEPSTFDEAFRPEWRVTFHDGAGKYEVRFPRTPPTYGAGPNDLRTQLEMLLELVRSLGGFGSGTGTATMIATLAARFVGLNVGNRVAAEVMAFALTLVKAVTADVVLGGKSFDDLDVFDFREWMGAHAIPGFPNLQQTAIMQVPYDGVFAYEGADQSRPVLSAGIAARGLLKLVTDYERAPYHTMMAGMGEAVFMPMLEVLRGRGVKLELFTKVKEIQMSGARVSQVRVARQAAVAAGQHAYDPVEVVKEVKTWRRQPDPTQLSASALGGQDPMSDAVDATLREDTLHDGVDFDWVICALPAPVTAKVLRHHEAHPVLADIAKIPTVATLHLQTWLTQPLHVLGWSTQSRVLGGFRQPLNSMLTVDELLELETWASPKPRSLLYLSGPFGGGWSRDSEDPAARAASDAAAFDEARTFVTHELGKLLTHARGPGGTFDTGVLHAPVHPADPMLDQYVRGNIDRHARYVLMKPGTLKHRPLAAPSTLHNLCFAGDWVRTGIDVPCIEGTVTSALQAANAILGPTDRITLLW